MAFAWKAAGITYNRYIAIASRTVRRSLKDEKRVQADKRDIFEIRVAKWENGKQGDIKNLVDVNAAAFKASAAAQSSA